MPISFMGYSQENLVKMVLLYERIEHAKNRDGFDLDKAIEKNYIRIKLPNDYIVTSGKKKMTKEEAVKKIIKDTECIYGSKFVNALEALGLIKFEEEKPEVRKLCSAQDGNDEFNFRVEQWGYPEDKKFVLWYNGAIVWRSWNILLDK